MQRFPSELRTPPLSTVLITGCEELHSQLEAFFSQNLKPPINVLLHDDSLNFDAFFLRKLDIESSEGFLKLSWVKRLRSEPVIIAVFVSRSELDSDPWSVMSKRLESFKDLCEVHHCKLITVIVNDQREDLSLEVLSNFKSRFSLDEKSLLTLLAFRVDPNDPSLIQLANNELKSIGHVFLETAWALHQTYVQRILLKSSQKVSPSPRVLSWDNTKLGFLAEMRQEWTTAIGQYTTGYHHLLEGLRTRRFASQYFVECLKVSEVLTMKICTLLMHQQRSEDAWKHFHFHLEKFRTLPDALTVGIKAFFLGWLSQQYLIILDIVQIKNGDLQSLLTGSIVSNRHLVNLYYHAAESAVQQRRHVSFAKTKNPTKVSCNPSLTHCGQFTCPIEDLDDQLLAMEAEKDLQKNSIELLEKTLQTVESCGCIKKEGLLSMMLAEERLASGDVVLARELLLKTADVYRKDGWNLLLSRTLKLIIEISSEGSWEKIVYSLELATIEDISESQERQKFADSAIDSLQQLRNYGYNCSSVIQEEEDSVDFPAFTGHLKTEIKGQDLSWGSILSLSCGFEFTEEKNPENLKFGVAVKNRLPVDLPIIGVSVHFQEQREEIRILSISEPLEKSLKSNEWNYFHLEFVPNIYGRIQAQSVEFHFQAGASLLWHLPQSTRSEILGLDDPYRQTSISPGLHSTHLSYVGSPPILTVRCPKVVYLGEEVGIQVEIHNKKESKVERLVMEVKSSPSRGEIKWKANNNMVLSVQDLVITPTEVYKQLEHLHIQNSATVKVKVVMRLHSEFEVVEKMEFEVKEPFEIAQQVYGDALSYLFVPSLDQPVEEEVKVDPLSAKTTTPPVESPLALPEGKGSFLSVSVRSKADCEMVVKKMEYSCEPESVFQVMDVSGKKTPFLLRENDISRFLLRIQPAKKHDGIVSLSLKLRWKRAEKACWKVLCEGEDQTDEEKEIEEDTERDYSLFECSIRKTVLALHLQPPKAITTGVPFSYTLHLTNETSELSTFIEIQASCGVALPQELDVALTEENGCLFCGDRKTKLLIQPQNKNQFVWECVAYSSGSVRLPKAEVSSQRLHASVELEGIEMFVQPPSLT